MSRRTSSEKIFHVIIDHAVAASGIQLLVAADADVILSPRSAVISSHAGGNFEYNLLEGGDMFLHGHIPSNDQKQVVWPEGFELAKGSGISINPITNDGSISLYYCVHDESAGVAKVDSRATTYAATLSGPKAIRTPGARGIGSQS